MERSQKRNRKTHEQLCRKKPGYFKTNSGRQINGTNVRGALNFSTYLIITAKKDKR